MEWTLAILLAVAIALLVLSFFKTEKPSKVDEQIEQLSISFMQELHQLKNQIRDMELDAEIAAHEPGAQARSSSHQKLLREILDLHKRGYSVEGIAIETELETHEVERLLAPYVYNGTKERKKAANES
ncbi:hypothetical protein CAY60_007795 [Shouchella clausii]|uniref:Uncharacterized protein n=3 Tax=Shouchella TaxID=2893057 RepID=Q5WHA1_SHOC1|nr:MULTISPECIES: hypothetical protein [Shouchella]MCM3312489.1 hypothetical protein [Psychrobacillus sp. MER TA 17]ALA51112.1 hypothetical protein DB29_00284 [Shouchella clausii]KKI86273.1 hypothetical protein WZ76_11450 [Shouchella clausii]MBU3231907.1 hypothetical protein [Shouchella clausii]MBU3264809.1 hypothetical protein [Shouchella clausii]